LKKLSKRQFQIKYQDKTIYLLDDGKRNDVKEPAQKYGVKYLSMGINIHYKAGNLNYGIAHSDGDFILSMPIRMNMYPWITAIN
jgi:cellulose synthase/poly-beta-1,6-N-acetylglucosamine synthase-like glycosyltransferase